jgi:hypothetical protein
MKARRGDDSRLAALPWAEQRTLEVATGASDGQQLASVSQAFGGIAETGTLVLASAPDNPTTLNFLRDAHIVAVAAVDIAALPRVISMITGPSRSTDTGQILILGAHGSCPCMCWWWVKLRKAERSEAARPYEDPTSRTQFCASCRAHAGSSFIFSAYSRRMSLRSAITAANAMPRHSTFITIEIVSADMRKSVVRIARLLHVQSQARA